MFKDQPEWTIQEIQKKMSDQPLQFVAQQARMMCLPKAGASGRNAKYVLKDTYK